MNVVYTVDTGASCSMVSSIIYDNLPICEKTSLSKIAVEITGANGSPLKCLGSAEFTLQLGSLEVKKSLIVADITDEVLLGADLMLDGSTDILLSQSVMVMQGVRIPLEQKITFLSRRVRLIAACTLPPMTEVIGTVTLLGEPGVEGNNEYIIEPTPELAKKYSVVMANTLVDSGQVEELKVKLMNSFSHEITLPCNLILGSASPVDQIQVFLDSDGQEEKHNNHCVRRLKLEHIKTDVEAGRDVIALK